MERDLEDNQVNRRGDDPVRRYEDDRQKQRYADEIDERERTGDDDLEQTRTFRSLDDYGRDGRSGVVASDSQSDSKGEYVGREDDRYVDHNIDSQETTEPVTEEEYARRGGIGAERDDVDSNTRGGDLADRRGEDYDYGATRERRDNVNRRNNDTL
ncbi:hypothetical protein GCM10007176_05900 [Salinicoccus roseus]|nr:hypothetical protein GCM10007176_05900 [Salinicoccus roseus]